MLVTGIHGFESWTCYFSSDSATHPISAPGINGTPRRNLSRLGTAPSNAEVPIMLSDTHRSGLVPMRSTRANVMEIRKPSDIFSNGSCSLLSNSLLNT